jgi:hypothetical protein
MEKDRMDLFFKVIEILVVSFKILVGILVIVYLVNLAITNPQYFLVFCGKVMLVVGGIALYTKFRN